MRFLDIKKEREYPKKDTPARYRVRLLSLLWEVWVTAVKLFHVYGLFITVNDEIPHNRFGTMLSVTDFVAVWIM